MNLEWPVIQQLGTDVVLASASPRRAAILKQVGIPFCQIASDIQEERRQDLGAEILAKQLAYQKAKAVARTRANSVVIGCDTMVVLDQEVLGKPANPDEAFAMLARLNGRQHRVCSGIALCMPSRNPVCEVATTQVQFRNMSPTELRWYANTGEGLDKAGAYGIQGKGGILVERIEGCYYNVVGFPLSCFVELIQQIVLV